jgi:cysteine desulfurase
VYVEGEALLTELDRRGFAVSSGSSCTSNTLIPSHVLVAMGALTSGNIRVSLHADVTDEEVERFLHVLPDAVAEVRAQLPSSTVGAPSVASVGATSSPELQSDPGIVVDSRGRRCPLPILDLARALPQLPLQAELTVLADDPAAASDVAAWCRMRGQHLVAVSPIGDGATAFRIRRLQ